MINVNDYKGNNDNEIIENAIKNRQKDGIVVISPRHMETESERDWWLIDRAILLPQDTTIILRNCKIKLSDNCRDNFFRTANCGLGIAYPERIKNVHIIGEGTVILEGADNPRATGDGTKILACPCPYEIEDLCNMAEWIPEEAKETRKITFEDRHNHSYGTDFGKEGESQFGDWRGIGILFANVETFTISNIRIVESHGWGISLEACAFGRIEKIDFDACMSKVIDGMRQNMENQDGIDLRNGCHNIIITDITGHTGDDLIALTAIARDNVRLGGELKNTHVMHSDWTKREKDIHDIIIRNVKGYSQLCCIIRLLPVNTKIRNVVIDGVIDASDDNIKNFACILLGEGDGGYGVNLRDSMKNIVISNVISKSLECISVKGYLTDSVISNIINKNEKDPIIVHRENGLNNVMMSNVCNKQA